MTSLSLFEKYQEYLRYIQKKTMELFEKYSLPRWLVFVFDSFAIVIIFFFAYMLRFNFGYSEIKFGLALNQSLLTLFVYAVLSLSFKSYGGIVRHTTLTDISLVFIVTSVSCILLLLISLISRYFIGNDILTIPVSIILIHYVCITVALAFIRVFIKMLFRFATSNMNPRQRVLIYGAGELGFIVKRVILSDPHGKYSVIGFLDDKKNLQGKLINGLPVHSPKIIAANFLHKYKIDTLLIAIKDLSPKRKSEIIETAISNGLRILETPAVDKWLNGQLQINQLQNVRLEDLLGRDPIRLNMDLIGKGLNKKTILVTGAAGSIGSEIVRQLARFDTKSIIMVDQAETPMFHLENELHNKIENLQYNLILADITNPEKMELIFNEFHPDVVFHAAAYKHVPVMEDNPHEAFRVNIGGTMIITNLAVKYGVEKFVMISTDKSVNPSSVMGASKRICEMIVQSRVLQPGIKTKFVITRFGNVLGSNGSVIPIFSKQIKEGGPVTVTHPEITRYFMTIPEACQLVLEAGIMGKGGEIFVFDMGKPLKINDLACQMIRLAGLVPDKDIKIVYIGLRPGEKLYEELLTNRELTKPTHHPKIRIAQVELLDKTDLLINIENLLGNLYTLSKEEVVNYCQEMVPEFKSTNVKFVKQLIMTKAV